jgi:hypothetical protein
MLLALGVLVAAFVGAFLGSVLRPAPPAAPPLVRDEELPSAAVRHLAQALLQGMADDLNVRLDLSAAEHADVCRALAAIWPHAETLFLILRDASPELAAKMPPSFQDFIAAALAEAST